MRSGRSPLVVVSAAALLLTAACGGGDDTAPAAQTSPERSGQAATATTPPPDTAPQVAVSASTASQTPAPTGTPACRNTQISLALAGGQGGAGTHIQRLEIVNNGDTCTMEGRPDVYPYNAAGQRMKGFKTAAVPADFGSIGGSPGQITLQKGGKAVFYLVVNDNSTSEKSCSDASGLAFLAPGDLQGAPAKLSWAWSPCPGTIRVSAIQPSTSTF